MLVISKLFSLKRELRVIGDTFTSTNYLLKINHKVQILLFCWVFFPVGGVYIDLEINTVL